MLRRAFDNSTCRPIRGKKASVSGEPLPISILSTFFTAGQSVPPDLSRANESHDLSWRTSFAGFGLTAIHSHLKPCAIASVSSCRL